MGSAAMVKGLTGGVVVLFVFAAIDAAAAIVSSGLGTPTLPAAVAGLVAVAYALRADFERYAITSVGVAPRVRRRVAQTPGGDCRECGTAIEAGDAAERRDYWQELVVFGAVVIRYNRQTATYCREHAAFEVRNDLRTIRSPDRTITQQTTVSAVQNDDPFAETVSSAGGMLSMLPLAILVLSASVVIGAINAVRGD